MYEVDQKPRAAPSTATRWQTPVRRYLGLWQRELRPDLEAFLREQAELTPSELAAILRADQRKHGESGYRYRRNGTLSDSRSCPTMPN